MLKESKCVTLVRYVAFEQKSFINQESRSNQSDKVTNLLPRFQVFQILSKTCEPKESNIILKSTLPPSLFYEALIQNTYNLYMTLTINYVH